MRKGMQVYLCGCEPASMVTSIPPLSKRGLVNTVERGLIKLRKCGVFKVARCAVVTRLFRGGAKSGVGRLHWRPFWVPADCKGGAGQGAVAVLLDGCPWRGVRVCIQAAAGAAGVGWQA